MAGLDVMNFGLADRDPAERARLAPQARETAWRWATVTATSPLTVRLDGETASLGVRPDNLVAGLTVGMRVFCALIGRRVVIFGAAGGTTPTGGGGATDPEVVRDVIGGTLTGTGLTVTPNDAGDTISLAVEYGTTAGTAAQGNDARLSNARTPTAHAASHASGGSDAITPASIGAAAASHMHGAADLSGVVKSVNGTGPDGAGNVNVATGGGGSLTWGSYAASASYSGEGPERAFDNNTTTAWTGPWSSGIWLRATASSPARVAYYTLRGRSSWDTRAPRSWTLEGSNDLSAWTVVDTRTLQTVPSSSAVGYLVATPGTYSHYRLVITATNGATDYVNVGEMTLSTAVPERMLPAATTETLGVATAIISATLAVIPTNRLYVDMSFATPASVLVTLDGLAITHSTYSSLQGIAAAVLLDGDAASVTTANQALGYGVQYHSSMSRSRVFTVQPGVRRFEVYAMKVGANANNPTLGYPSLTVAPLAPA